MKKVPAARIGSTGVLRIGLRVRKGDDPTAAQKHQTVNRSLLRTASATLKKSLSHLRPRLRDGARLSIRCIILAARGQRILIDPTWEPFGCCFGIPVRHRG
jgi:signal transduction histidine kinase